MKKQAIILIAHKSFKHIKEFCEQFNNDPRFNIYIHYDTKLVLSKSQIDRLLNTFTNIKSIYSVYNGQYCHISLVDAEIILIRTALQNPDNIVLHTMSELDRIIVSLDDFYNIHTNNPKNYIMMNNCKSNKGDYWRIINPTSCFYFGSQWWSLTADTLRTLFAYNKYDAFYKMLYEYSNKYVEHRQALDEVFFQNLMYLTNSSFVNNCTRYVDWTHREKDPCHPATIECDKPYFNKQLEDIVNDTYLIVRKIDTTTINGKNTLAIIKNKLTEDIHFFPEISPKVSVCMCTRNRAITMLPAIKCILSQNYPNLEFVIIDDCSNDDTQEILEQLQKQDKRIKYHRLNEHNFINARNEAFKQATGEYIALIDSDDKCSPNKIVEQLKFLIKHPDIDVVGCKIKFGNKSNYLSIPNSLNEWTHEFFRKEIQTENISMLVHFPSIMFRKSILDKVFDNGLYFYPELSNGGEDQIFLYTLYLCGARFGNINNATYLYNYLEYDDAISATNGKHFDESNFIFKYIHNKPFEEKIKVVTELYNKYNK